MPRKYISKPIRHEIPQPVDESIRHIPLHRYDDSIFAIVDAEDFELYGSIVWSGYKTHAGAVYAKRKESDGTCLSLHRLILGCSDGDIGDHIDGNTLNNRRCNLRKATVRQNAINKKMNVRNKSGYRGVSLHKGRGKWVAQININGKRKGLGYFDSPELAYAVYSELARNQYGEFRREAA